MTPLELANAAIVLLGIPTIVGAMIFIGRKLQKLDDLEKTVDTVKHNVKVVSDTMIRVSPEHFDPREIKGYSPLALTDEGEAFVREIGFDAVFDEHEEEFFSVIEEGEPTLRYDVEQAAIKAMYLLADEPYMQFLKVYLYNHPQRTFENVAPTLGLYVRDRYLDAHPEISE